MEIKSIGSSSKGCCYIIESGGNQLIIEIGISLRKVRKAFCFNLSSVIGCLVSHAHSDHAKYLPDLEKTGIPIWCTKGTKKRFKLSLCNCIQDREIFKPGADFRIMPIELRHDIQCFSFLIASERDLLFYISDSGNIPLHRIDGLTHLMIEANHSFEKLIESDLDKPTVGRISENHLDIDTVEAFCTKHKKTLQEVHLIHLSDQHSDESEFKKRIQRATGCPVFIAGK